MTAWGGCRRRGLDKARGNVITDLKRRAWSTSIPLGVEAGLSDAAYPSQHGELPRERLKGRILVSMTPSRTSQRAASLGRAGSRDEAHDFMAALEHYRWNYRISRLLDSQKWMYGLMSLRAPELDPARVSSSPLDFRAIAVVAARAGPSPSSTSRSMNRALVVAQPP